MQLPPRAAEPPGGGPRRGLNPREARAPIPLLHRCEPATSTYPAAPRAPPLAWRTLAFFRSSRANALNAVLTTADT
jgi:hypothetical protein